MDILKFLLPFIAFIVVVSWMGRLKKRLKRNQMDDARQIVERHGWQLYEESATMPQYRITGQTRGIRWQVITDVNEGTADASFTRFTCDEIEYTDLVAMIRSRRELEPDKLRGEGADERRAKMLVKLGAMNASHAQLVRDGVDLTPRNSSVDDYYTIVVRPGLEHFLTMELEAALEGWRTLNIPDRDSLALDVGQTNLRLSCRHVIEPQEIEAFAAIGVAAVIALANRAS